MRIGLSVLPLVHRSIQPGTESSMWPVVTGDWRYDVVLFIYESGEWTVLEDQSEYLSVFTSDKWLDDALNPQSHVNRGQLDFEELNPIKDWIESRL